MKKVSLLLLLFSIMFSSSIVTAAKGDIKLTAPDKSGGKPLMEALTKRQTNRDFNPSKKLSNKQLSNLLYAAAGVNRKDGKRTAPTAVNWQEIDIYVALKSGLYLFDAKKHALKLVMKKDFRADSGTQDFTKDAFVCLIYVADFSKMKGSLAKKKFYSATDTGYVSQNVYLYAASEGLNTVVLGWVEKEKLHKKMKLKKHQKIILTQPVGYGK